MSDVLESWDRLREPLNAEQRASRKGPYAYYGANGQVDSIDAYRYDGDYLLVAEDGGYFDQPERGVAYMASGRFWVNNHAHVLQARGDLPLRYFLYALNAINWMPHVGGSTRLKLTAGALARVPVALPPLNEQWRIVEKLDAIFEQTRAAKARLERLPGLLDKLKRSILAAAFRGDLTADWRATHPDVEPASALLSGLQERRRSERSKRHDHDEAIDGLFTVPSTWEWSRFADIASDLRGGTSTRAENAESQWPVLRSSAVRQGKIDFSDVRYLASGHEEVDADLVRTGDLLFTRLSGTLEYVGNCAVVDVPPERPTYYPDRIFRAQLDSSFLCADFVALAFSVQSLRGALETAAKSTAGHQRISLSDLREFVLPVPPFAEQKEIARRTRAVLEAVSEMGSRLERSHVRLTNLEQGALAKAFRGELVAQDPTDEPTATLIERLRATDAVGAPPATSRTRTPNGKRKLPLVRRSREASEGAEG